MSNTQAIDRQLECLSDSNVVDLAAYRAARERAEDESTREGRRDARRNAEHELVYRNLIEQELLALARADLEQRMDLTSWKTRSLEDLKGVLIDLAQVPDIVRRELRELLPAIENTCRLNLMHEFGEKLGAPKPRRTRRSRTATARSSARKRGKTSAST